MTGFVLENISSESEVLATILWGENDHLRNEMKCKAISGVQFVTNPTSPQQVGIIHHPTGQHIPRHEHHPYERTVKDTTEVIFIMKGVLIVDIYNKSRELVWSGLLHAGSAIILVSGGHGFTIMDECLLVEVKQGPYHPTHDKERF